MNKKIGAVITGGETAIGAAYAEKLAHLGMNVNVVGHYHGPLEEEGLCDSTY